MTGKENGEKMSHCGGDVYSKVGSGVYSARNLGTFSQLQRRLKSVGQLHAEKRTRVLVSDSLVQEGEQK